MQPRCCFAFTLLCSLSLLSSVLSIQCNETQYEWPVFNPKYCCNKCRPGEYMDKRSNPCDIKCKPCESGKFQANFSVAQFCKFCVSCNKPNMEHQSRCNATHNAVCRCKAGYECQDQSCKDCVRIQTTTTPTLPPSTTVSMESARSHAQAMPAPKPLGDTVWFLVIIALLAVGTAVIVLTKMKPFLRWIKSVNLFSWLCPPSEDPEDSKPVQDTCGKCDQPLVTDL